MSGQWIFIEPCDVWMFRDNKPFNAQQNFVARSIFPPTPQTMQGVIRTHYLEQKGADWNNLNGQYPEVGDAISMGALRISGPFVARRQNGAVERLFRAPLDLLHKRADDESAGEYRLLEPASEASFLTGSPFTGWRPLTGGGDGFKEAKDWLTEAQFKSYLSRQIGSLGKLTEEHEVYEKEERVGLALNRGRRANEQGMFYHAEFIRPVKDVGVLVQVEPQGWFAPNEGYINIGGESRSGHYTVVSEPGSLNHASGTNVRLVLLTPAYFSGGYQPMGTGVGRWDRWLGKDARLVSVVLDKPQHISGWDMANDRPRPLRHFVPAGSVYYFENATISDQPFTENSPEGLEFGAMGFGAIAAGSW